MGSQNQEARTYRDPLRSSNGHFVKASGLRWLSLMLLPCCCLRSAGPDVAGLCRS
jgi:hypothetical protein